MEYLKSESHILKKMRVLIIEDEKLLRMELIKQLNVYNDIEVVNCIQTVKESINWLSKRSASIDLIFMDIELADGICFEIFESIDVSIPIIFLTAYSEYSIRAFKVNSIDYLLKPINPEELDFAIRKFRNFSPQVQNHDPMFFKDLYSKITSKNPERFLIRSGNDYKYVTTHEIAYFFAEDKYTTIVTFKGSRYVIDESLTQLEAILQPEKFYRVSRNIIVNIEAILKASKYFNSRLKLYLVPDFEFDIVISRAKVKDFLKWMGTNS